MKIILVMTFIAIIALTLSGRAESSWLERSLLFYPSNRHHDNSLTPWVRQGEIIGYSRKVESPQNVWLMLHGNAGQASDRIYAIPSFSIQDSVFIMEYPGYGGRRGTPSMESFNRAAKEAYMFLRETYPNVPVCVVAESIGSGPAAFLATLPGKPDKLVFIAPFDNLVSVAKRHFSSFLVRIFLRSRWDNVEALSGYSGPVDIFAAEKDTIIPTEHAKALAESIPGAKLVLFRGDHNDWSYSNQVKIRNP